MSNRSGEGPYFMGILFKNLSKSFLLLAISKHIRT